MKSLDMAVLPLGLLTVVAVVPSVEKLRAQEAGTTFRPEIPRTWDDAAMAELEVPLADPVGSPRHASADYYYRTPVLPIYKSYAVYAPGHEPPGYLDWLTRQEPVVIWDDKGHRPPLETEADWIKAGEIAYDAPVTYGFVVSAQKPKSLFVRDPEWYRQTSVLAFLGVTAWISQDYTARIPGRSGRTCVTWPDAHDFRSRAADFEKHEVCATR